MGTVKEAKFRGVELNGSDAFKQPRPFGGYPISDNALNILFEREPTFRRTYERIRTTKFATVRLEKAPGTTTSSVVEQEIVKAMETSRKRISKNKDGRAPTERRTGAARGRADQDLSAIAVMILKDAHDERKRTGKEDSETKSDISMRTWVSYMGVDIDPNNIPSSQQKLDRPLSACLHHHPVPHRQISGA